MLVLTRRPGEEVVLPDLGISMKVLGINGNQVSVGLTAPSEVRIFRGEVWARVQVAPVGLPIPDHRD